MCSKSAFHGELAAAMPGTSQQREEVDRQAGQPLMIAKDFSY
jgi:hypothetical protein